MNKDTHDKLNNFENEFAKRLNELTGELKQEAIADATFCTRQSVSNYVNGKRIPDAQFVWDFLHAVNDEYNDMGYGDINANYLFGLSDSMLYEDEKIESVCNFSNETILNLKNIAKSKKKLKALDILLQNSELANFLDGFYDFIFSKENNLDSQLDSKTTKNLLEFNLSKLTNKFVSNMTNDIAKNDSIVDRYDSLLNYIDIFSKYLNGEIKIDDVNTFYGKTLRLAYDEGGDERVKQLLEEYKHLLKAMKRTELKNLKRIYNDRYNIKIDSNE